MMKSRHFSSGFAINSVCFLLLISVYFTSTVVQSELCTLSNWIEQSKGQWPNAGSSEPFLVFHSEYKNSKLFGLNKSLRNENWLNDPDLSFKYWVSEQTYFRSRKEAQSLPERDLKLIPDTTGWKSFDDSEKNLKYSLKSISKEQWDGFGFENSDIFTMGLKDVSVKFVKKIDTNQENLYTAYPTDATGFKLINFVTKKPTIGGEGAPAISNNDVIPNDNANTIIFNGKNIEKIEKLSEWKFKKFLFNYKKDGTNDKKSVTITVKNDNTCTITEQQPYAQIFKNSKCANGFIDTLQIEKTDKFEMSEIKGFLDASKAAFVTKLPSEYTKKLYKNSPPLTTTGKTYYINSTTILETKYTQVKGYIQLNEVRPPISDTINAPKDTCYLITKNGHAASSVDVYLTLPDKKVGFKLDTVIDTKQICLFDYVALQNIDKYMITLIAYGDVTQDFSIIVDTKYEKLAEKLLFVPDGTIKLDSLNWFYNNPIFENVVTTDDPEPKLLMICDVLSSCYPLKPTENNPSNYALPPELKNVLDSSPFFQIRGSIKNDKKISFAKITTDQAQETFNKGFIKENAQFLTEVSKTKNPLNKPSDYQLIFNENKQLKIDFSLDSIDMRFQKLKVNIELVNQDGSLADKTKNKLLLDSFILKKENNEWSFPIATLPSAKISLNTFSTATDELFSLRPTQYLTESKITLQLKLENSEPSAKGLLTNIKFTILPLGTQKLETKKITSSESLILKGKQLNEDIGVSKGFSIGSHKTRFFLTEFIENAGLTKLGQTNLNMNFKITSEDTKPEDYIVYRVIVDQNNPQFEQIYGKFIDPNKKTEVKFSDTVKPEDKTPVTGRFRVLYIVHSNNKKQINVKVEKFTVEGKETTDTDNDKATQLLAHVNLKYEPAVCAHKTELNNNVCPLPNNINQITEIKCDMAVGCNNIFDRQLPISIMEPTDPTEKFRFVPFKLASGKREDHQLVIKRKDLTSAPKPDFCVKFSYLAKTTALFVTDDSDNQNTIKLPLTLDSENFKNLKSNFKVCASHFTENVDSVNSFVFYFEHHELDIDNHFVQIETDDLNKQTGLSNIILPTGIYINNLDKSQFLEISNNWNPEFDKTTMFKNKLTFQLKSDDLEVLEANGKNGTNEFYYETLRSKWIKMPVEGASLKYGLTFNNALSKNNNSIVVNENTIVRIISSRTASKSNQLNSFKTDAVTTLEKALPPISDNNKKLTNEHYRLEIELVLDVTKKNALKKNNKLIKDDLVLVIENLNINDPCIVGGAVSTLQKCHPIKNKQNIEIGLEDPATAYNWCERGYNSSIFGPICHCNKNYTGDTCENENYCKTQGFAVCGEERLCKNDEEFKQIKCDCKRQEEKWNPFFKGCINPVDLTKCGENSRPQYTKNGVTCKCLDDYTEVIQNATKICVPFEPCNKEHRKLLKIKIPCPNANTICELTGSKTQENDFQCNCNTGFININGVRTTNAKCLPQVCKSCLGRCKSTGKDYICDKKLSCDQQPGYDYNSTSNECEFNGDKFAKLLGCAAGTTAEFGSDGNPACKCAEGQKLDLISRKCSETECNDKAMNACSSRGASKCTFNSGKAFCECKDTDVPYAEHLNGSDWKCISKCDLLEKPDLYEARCSNSFEHCNGKAIMQFAPLRSGSTTDNTDGTKNAVETPYIKNIFVYNFTSFSIPSTTNQKPHCACDLGFNWNSGKCFPSTIPTHTISNFEFDLIHTNDEAGYIENVRKTFVKLVAAVVVIKDKSSLASLNSATKCKKADEKSILCETSFQSSLTNEEITKKFAAACVPISTDKNKCFYVVNPTNTFFSNFLTRSAIDDNNFANFDGITNSPPKDSDSVLVHNPTIDLKVTKEEYCSKNKNTCSNYAYSVCKDDGAKPFECLCPVKEKSFFKVIDSKKFSFIENGKTIDLQMETCGIHNMCKVDKNNFGCMSDALCHFQVELDDVKKEYFGVSYCTCPTGIILSDRSLSCQESCNGFCSNNTVSCGQDYLNTKKIICNCKDGFTGSKCEKKATEAKKEAEASSSKAYLISTIVVSVIAAIALIGLAILYFKRR